MGRERSDEPPLSRALRAALDTWQASAVCPGASVSLLHPSVGAWRGASGTADGGPGYVYSITKTFTAIRALQLAEQGTLGLDDPVTRHLPRLTLPPAVTIRRLLNHTAGVPSYTDRRSYFADLAAHPSEPWTFDEAVAKTCRGALDFEPGAGWHYSNTGYMLLRAAIETVTRESFAGNVERGICAPLGLRDTHAAEAIDLVPGYHPGWCLTGLVISTAAEVTRLYEALFAGRLVGAESLDEMRSPVPVGETHPFFARPSYGLGLMIDPEFRLGPLYGHGGDGPGYNAWAMHLPECPGGPLTLAVICNASLAEHPFELVERLLEAAL